MLSRQWRSNCKRCTEPTCEAKNPIIRGEGFCWLVECVLHVLHAFGVRAVQQADAIEVPTRRKHTSCSFMNVEEFLLWYMHMYWVLDTLITII